MLDKNKTLIISSVIVSAGIVLASWYWLIWLAPLFTALITIWVLYLIGLSILQTWFSTVETIAESRANTQQSYTRRLYFREMSKEANVVIEEVVRQLKSGALMLTDFQDFKFQSLVKASATKEATQLLEAPHKSFPPKYYLEDHIDKESVSNNQLFLGYADNNEPIFSDFTEMFHLIIGGSSRWGKSEFMTSLMTQFLWNLDEEIEFILIDTGGTTFMGLGLPVILEPRDAVQALSELLEECNRRRDMFMEVEAKTLIQYRLITGEKMARIVVVIEEGVDLSLEAKAMSPVLTRLVSKAAKLGVHIVFMAQSTKTTVIDKEARDNFSSKFQFKAEDHYQANILISKSGAETIKSRGRFYAVINASDSVEVQGPLVRTETYKLAAQKYREHRGITPVESVEGEDETVIWDMGSMDKIIDVKPKMVNGLPVVSDDLKAKEKLDQFFRACSNMEVNLERHKDGDLLVHLGLSTSGRHYRMIKEYRTSAAASVSTE